MTHTIATCRDCGAQGLEDPDDIAPGLCPPCLDRRMATATEKLRAAPSYAHGLRLLRAAGLRERFARKFLREVKQTVGTRR